MPELTHLLDGVLQGARFTAGPYSALTAPQLRSLYQTAQHMMGGASLASPGPDLTMLVNELDRELDVYIEPETRRIGTGLVSLMGGAVDDGEPRIPDFARTLVRAAAILGPARAVEMLRGWIAGEPYRYRMVILLTGVSCDEPLALAEGVPVEPLPRSSDVLATYLPFSLGVPGVNFKDFSGRPALIIDGTAEPALYRPLSTTPGEPRTPRSAWAKPIPCFTTDAWRRRLPEALSLACDTCVEWTHIWRDAGDLRAFGGISRGPESRGDVTPSRHRGPLLQQARWESAQDLDAKRRVCAHRGRSLDMAIRRWINSKRPQASSPDAFIDLRIALESLYLPGGTPSEQGFRLALLGAWDLGADFDERRRYYRLLREAYYLGATAVHAGTRASRATLAEAQAACRTAILKRMTESTKPAFSEVDVALGAPGR